MVEEKSPSAPLLNPSAPELHAPPDIPEGMPRVEPWEVGPQNIYQDLTVPQYHFHAPQHNREDPTWKETRLVTLREWGARREQTLHRAPSCLMDQMMSGSGLYPIRLLDPAEWLTDNEIAIATRLEEMLHSTGHAHTLALDMLTPLIYHMNVKIILDNSGSMQADMFGNSVDAGYYGRGTSNEAWIDRVGNGPFTQDYRQMNRDGQAPIHPNHRRWFFARDALIHWMNVYRTMGMDPPIYLLNRMPGYGYKAQGANIPDLFTNQPHGSTGLTECIHRALDDHRREVATAGRDNGLLLLILTDGEANNMVAFNQLLDAIQNGRHGDVQVCLLGVSLQKEDIEWFENEECDDTRIRTIEAFEVELAQMQRREVVKKEGDYNFAMHTFRALLTNLFPADYDYEAPNQNIRHRAYVTCHGKDRWLMQTNGLYCCVSSIVGLVVCTPLYLATGCCCCGWLQGNDCGKCRSTQAVECLADTCGDD